MSYFDFLSKEQKQRMFLVPPSEEPLDADKETLAHALGATLYTPGNSCIAIGNLIDNKIPGLFSTVLCLEDAVADREVEDAEKYLALQLKTLLPRKEKGGSPPFIFIRVRNIDQFRKLTRILGPCLLALTGFVFPKFDTTVGYEYFDHLQETNNQLGKQLYGMPILEGTGVAYLESRISDLLSIKKLLNQYQDLVLNIRMGATDLSGLYGLRRSPEITIYDIAVIKNFIADLINVFGRPEDGYVISGPVWEYFNPGSRVLKPQLRQSPFHEQFGREGQRVRQHLLCNYLDGLIREVMLDKANGLVGKTIIHPSHLLPVQALYAVSHEEFCDARDILKNGGNGGVTKSIYNNKMNEAKPHLHWAKKIIKLANIYGVLNEQYDYASIIYKGKQSHCIE